MYADDIHNDELKERLKAVLEEGITEETMKSMSKKVQDIMCQVEDDIMYRLKDNLAPGLAAYVKDMAQKSVEMLLEGNENMMREYLSCKSGSWTGRSTDDVWGCKRELHEKHPIIHGDFFEQGCIKLRRDIVNAHRDLLVNERILDLEDQVKSLVAQVNKAKDERDKMWERCKDYMP